MPVILTPCIFINICSRDKKLSHKHTNFGTFSIFSIFAFIYYVTIPLELYLTNNVEIYKGSIIDYYDQIFILILSILALLGFYYGLKLSKFSPISKLSNSEILLENGKEVYF